MTSPSQVCRPASPPSPEAVLVARVVGDATHDRIVANLPLRHRYRAALGLRRGQKLVLVSSTWGAGSSFGRLDALLPRCRLSPACRDRLPRVGAGDSAEPPGRLRLALRDALRGTGRWQKPRAPRPAAFLHSPRHRDE